MVCLQTPSSLLVVGCSRGGIVDALVAPPVSASINAEMAIPIAVSMFAIVTPSSRKSVRIRFSDTVCLRDKFISAGWGRSKTARSSFKSTSKSFHTA